MSALTIATSGLEGAVADFTARASNVANAQDESPLAAETFGPATTVGASASATTPPPYTPIQVLHAAAPGGGVTTSYAAAVPASEPAYDPASPYANSAGMVAVPRVDLAQESVGQLTDLRWFQANLAVLKAYDEMQQSLLDALDTPNSRKA
jgi:flagellar basal-body rod protein FlgC